MKNRRRKTITPEEFVVLWEKAHSLQHFLSLSKMSLSAAHCRAKGFRRKGINLKHLGTSLNTIERISDVRDLAESVASPWDADKIMATFSDTLKKSA